MVAAPGDPGQGIPVRQAGRVKISLAYGGSCTGGKWEDWVRYHQVLAWGLARGLRVADHVKLFLQYGSADVQRRVHEAGWETDFSAAGAQSVAAGCGACIDMGPGASSHGSDVTVSAQNRNFPGRSGPGSVWLASPETVAASALMGYLASFEQLQESVAA
jgi:3-isopropylmalate/(R)-2-methylmalate dehydratase large subunit